LLGYDVSELEGRPLKTMVVERQYRFSSSKSRGEPQKGIRFARSRWPARTAACGRAALSLFRIEVKRPRAVLGVGAGATPRPTRSRCRKRGREKELRALYTIDRSSTAPAARKRP